MAEIDKTAQVSLGGFESQDFSQVSLVLYHATGAEVVPLHLGQPVVIGRQAPSDIVVADPKLSRQHASFCWRGQELVVEDLGSTNGTKVNGRRIHKAAVGEGDSVAMGHVRAALHRVEPREIKAVERERQPSKGMIFASPAMVRVDQTISRIAQSPISVLVHGETGTGKELIAQEIHDKSDRHDGALVAVNCGAVPVNLLESTLFGHVRGAFTGAERDAPGVFEQADGGTIFLDEIGELTPGAQAALLRTLETRTVRRVGGTQDKKVNVRVVAATHRDLQHMCDEGSFRLDLLFRLNAVVIEIPPLRDRREDIEPLALHFLKHTDNGRDVRPTAIAMEALDLLLRYAWPGNVRELRNEIERAAIMSTGSAIDVADLSPRIQQVQQVTARHSMAPGSSSSSASVELEATLPNGAKYKDLVKDFEKDLIRRAYVQAEGNRQRAAEILAMPLRTFNHKFKTLEVHESLG